MSALQWFGMMAFIFAGSVLLTALYFAGRDFRRDAERDFRPTDGSDPDFSEGGYAKTAAQLRKPEREEMHE